MEVQKNGQAGSTRRKLVLGIVGYGVVGQGLYDILASNPNLDLTIKKFVIKNPTKERNLDPSYFSTDISILLNDDEITTVVELIDDADAAFEIVSEALRRGKDVVSANKKMIAYHLEELVEIQKQTGASLLYEGAVCGSIPIIRNLEEYYDNELLLSVSGIFNGSSNYILTKIFNEKTSYQEALQQAQQLGFAETNPILDVGGFDPKFKLLLLTAHAYGLFLKPAQIFNHGIQFLHEIDVSYARSHGFKIKLKPQVYSLGEGRVAAHVLPCFVPENQLLGQVEYENNAVLVKAAFADEQLFYGKGAGGHPTGAAVLSDIAALRYAYKYEYKKHLNGFSWTLDQQATINVYLRFLSEKGEKQLKFTEIEKQWSIQDAQGNSHSLVMGQTTIQHLHEAAAWLTESAAFISEFPR